MAFARAVFAEQLRMHRARLDMSQDRLSELSGVPRATIHVYERGEVTPSADKLWALSEALGCTPNDLCGYGSDRGAA